MSDKVELYINKARITHFLSYRIDADLYTPADAFSLELANPDTDIAPGLTCELKINGALELTGVIDKVVRKISKSNGVSLTVEGRDLMGLLVDSYCEPPWRDIENMRLKTLADLLLAKVPFISRKDILYQESIVGKGKKASATGYLADLDQGQRIGRIEAGMTIFEVLKNFSMSRGMLCYCQPSGTLVFGRPLASARPEYRWKSKETGKTTMCWNRKSSGTFRGATRRSPSSASSRAPNRTKMRRPSIRADRPQAGRTPRCRFTSPTCAPTTTIMSARPCAPG
jgi:prophage tail gpP-like protein